MEVKRTERGWAGHFIFSKDCLFRRNTLLEYGDKKWVVSTVGCQRARMTVPGVWNENEIVTIGADRWYETMAFEAEKTSQYHDADVLKEIEFESEWGIWGKTWDEVLENTDYLPDLAANEMHEKVVEELMEMIKL